MKKNCGKKIEDLDTIAGRTRHFRKKMGLSQRELAQQINVSITSLCEIENSKHKPNCDFLEGISRVFNVNLYWLLFGAGEMILDPGELLIKQLPRFQSNPRDIGTFLRYFRESAIVHHSVLAFFLTLLFKEKESIEKEISENADNENKEEVF